MWNNKNLNYVLLLYKIKNLLQRRKIWLYTLRMLKRNYQGRQYRHKRRNDSQRAKKYSKNKFEYKEDLNGYSILTAKNEDRQPTTIY